MDLSGKEQEREREGGREGKKKQTDGIGFSTIFPLPNQKYLFFFFSVFFGKHLVSTWMLSKRTLRNFPRKKTKKGEIKVAFFLLSEKRQ